MKIVSSHTMIAVRMHSADFPEGRSHSYLQDPSSQFRIGFLCLFCNVILGRSCSIVSFTKWVFASSCVHEDLLSGWVK